MKSLKENSNAGSRTTGLLFLEVALLVAGQAQPLNNTFLLNCCQPDNFGRGDSSEKMLPCQKATSSSRPHQTFRWRVFSNLLLLSFPFLFSGRITSHGEFRSCLISRISISLYFILSPSSRSHLARVRVFFSISSRNEKKYKNIVAFISFLSVSVPS